MHKLWENPIWVAIHCSILCCKSIGEDTVSNFSTTLTVSTWHAHSRRYVTHMNVEKQPRGQIVYVTTGTRILNSFAGKLADRLILIVVTCQNLNRNMLFKPSYFQSCLLNCTKLRDIVSKSRSGFCSSCVLRSKS